MMRDGSVKQANNVIFEVLKKRIIELEMKPGDVINEKDLIVEFEVSRTPVREALIKLSQIDLVEIRPRVGTFVTQIDLATVKSAYEVKKNLEGSCGGNLLQNVQQQMKLGLYMKL